MFYILPKNLNDKKGERKKTHTLSTDISGGREGEVGSISMLT